MYSNSFFSFYAELPENWTDTREPVQDGMTFYLKYVGSTLVEELEEGESYGDRVSKNAITTIVNMVKYFCSSPLSLFISATHVRQS